MLVASGVGDPVGGDQAVADEVCVVGGVAEVAAVGHVFSAIGGFDAQAVGLAAPLLMSEFNLTKLQLAPIFAVGLVGMTLGAALGGMVGDKWGRKTALIASAFIFGSLTLAMAVPAPFPVLLALRFLAGFGLGGALPNATALTGEFSPARYRSFAISISILCIPLGGILGGTIATTLLPMGGWRALFIAAGALPLFIAGILYIFLPESPKFLAIKHGRGPALEKIISRLKITVGVSGAGLDRGNAAAGQDDSPGFFSPVIFKKDSYALWGSFFFCLLAVYLGYNWLPAMLTGAGFSPQVASVGLISFNMGGVIGALIGAALLARFGSKILGVIALAGAIGAVIPLVHPLTPAWSSSSLMFYLGFEGGCTSGLQVVLYALAAHLYPTEARARGVGSASGLGRVGAIVSTYVGAAALSELADKGFFIVVVGCLIATSVAIYIVGNHIPGRQTSGPALKPELS